MSKNTVLVDQFILNKLQPEIDRLNLSLISMEENGFDNNAMSETRKKLNALLPHYDFLKEYATGNEEIEDIDLMSIIKQAGYYKSSMKSNDQIIQSTVDSLDINANSECKEFIRIYINNEILKSNILTPYVDTVDFKIFVPETATSLNVTITPSGELPQSFSGVNNVTIPDILLYSITAVILDIIYTNICGKTVTEQLVLEVQDVETHSIKYWVGSTVERFTISDALINESTNITIDPNSGTVVVEELTYDWVTENFDLTNKLLYKGTVNHDVKAYENDAHVLIIVPDILQVTNVSEYVLGMKVAMTYDIHYSKFTITHEGNNYSVYYFRDLTDFIFPERTFNFDISTV